MTNPRRVLFLLVFLPVGLLFLGMHLYLFALTRSIQLPPYRPIDIQYSDQNWTDDERQWFYHESQGGAFELIVPYEWLIALEQPRIPFSIFGSVPKLMDVEYVSRFGFLPNPRESYDPLNVRIPIRAEGGSAATTGDVNVNPDLLPVGFARNRDYRWPINSESPIDVVGFTCAACHTAQLDFEKDGIRYGVRVDGGPALTNLNKFEIAVGVSIGLTLLPRRFDRFARAVLKGGDTPEARDSLRSQLKAIIARGKRLEKIAEPVYTTEEGFGRLDALDRIGNFVFAEEVIEANWSLFDDVSNAPVSFPPIWDAPWFDWVQYNASIKRPMVRNTGEAMGVFARVDFDSLDDPELLFKSNVKFENLHQMESLIRGPEPFRGLKSPNWPEQIFGRIDRDLAEQGRALFRTHCESCHHPLPLDGPAYADRSDSVLWTRPELPDSLQYLNLKIVNLYEIGTDPLTAVNFARRVVDLGALGEQFRDTLGVGKGGLLLEGDALPFLVTQTIQKGYKDLGLSDSLQQVWNGMRPNEVRAPLAYKARPLNGVWATAPYLHNGSVPTLYQMLSPHSERDETFYVGNREFDPTNVGYVTTRVRGGFKFDTSVKGNSNYGHLFDGDFDPRTVNWDTLRTGVIGPFLPEPERKAIVEFLKTQ